MLNNNNEVFTADVDRDKLFRSNKRVPDKEGQQPAAQYKFRNWQGRKQRNPLGMPLNYERRALC